MFLVDSAVPRILPKTSSAESGGEPSGTRFSSERRMFLGRL